MDCESVRQNERHLVAAITRLRDATGLERLEELRRISELFDERNRLLGTSAVLQ
jgi:hypothetical protein